MLSVWYLFNYGLFIGRMLNEKISKIIFGLDLRANVILLISLCVCFDMMSIVHD